MTDLLQALVPALPLLLFLVGLFVGSFLNVVIHRLPIIMEREWIAQAAELRGDTPPEQPRYNLAVPRSRCPHCGHSISVLENIPILSYLLLRGQCKHCHTPISLRYPLVELLSALLCSYAGWKFGPSLMTLGALFFIWFMLALAFIDFDTQLLPDQLTLPLLWLGLLFNLEGVFVALPQAVIGAMAGYLILWTIYWLFKLLTGKEGMGYGDFKLLAAIGAWLGWSMLPLTIIVSSFVGVTLSIAMMAKGRIKQGQPFSFGPYLAFAGIIAFFWGEGIVAAYLSLL